MLYIVLLFWFWSWVFGCFLVCMLCIWWLLSPLIFQWRLFVCFSLVSYHDQYFSLESQTRLGLWPSFSWTLDFLDPPLSWTLDFLDLPILIGLSGPSFLSWGTDLLSAVAVFASDLCRDLKIKVKLWKVLLSWPLFYRVSAGFLLTFWSGPLSEHSLQGDWLAGLQLPPLPLGLNLHY